MFDMEVTIASVIAALDDLAGDDNVSTAEYVDALESIASTVDVRLEAARLDLGRTT